MEFTGHLKKVAKGSLPFTFQRGKLESKNIPQIWWRFLTKVKPRCQLGNLIKFDSLEKTLLLGKIEGRRRRGNRGWDGWMASQPNGHEFEQILGDSEGQGSLGAVVGGFAKSWAWLSDWNNSNSFSPKLLPIPSRYQDLLLWSCSLLLSFLKHKSKFFSVSYQPALIRNPLPSFWSFLSSVVATNHMFKFNWQKLNKVKDSTPHSH